MSHARCTGGPDGDRIREYNTGLPTSCGHDKPPLALPRDSYELEVVELEVG